MAEDNRNKPLYMISVAAELTGMHPQTLRVYESKGLVNPQRSGGNTRLYSRADIERLELINQLTDDPDRNIAAALAAGSWRDMTRVALTDPDRTRAMVEEDADNVERLLRMMAARLTEVADELHGADAGAIAAFFADGQPFRDYKSAVRSGADGDGPVFDLTIPAEGWQAALLDSARRGEHILRFGDDYTACVQRRSAM